MKSNITAFFKKHVKISVIILIFMFLILLPQFNFCSSKQVITTDIKDITLTYPNGGEEIPKGSTINITWDTTIETNHNDEALENENNTNENNDVTYSLNRSDYTAQGNNIIEMNTETKKENTSDKAKINLAKQIEKKIENDIKQSFLTLDCSFVFNPAFQVIAIVVGSVAVVAGLVTLIVIQVKDSNKNDYSNHINIELYQDDEFKFTIAHRRRNDGEFEWDIPKKVSGRNFKIKIVSSINNEIFDYSDESFSILDESLIDNDKDSSDEGKKNSSNNTSNDDETNGDTSNDDETNGDTSNDDETNGDTANDSTPNDGESNDAVVNDNGNVTTSKGIDQPIEFMLNGYNQSVVKTSSKHSIHLNEDYSDIHFNQLPKDLKHHMYFNLQSITDKTETLSDKKSQVLNKMMDEYLEYTYKNTIQHREVIEVLLQGSFEDNLHLYDEIDEIVMGFDSIDKNTHSLTSIAMLMKLSSIYGLINRLEGSTEHIKSIIDGYDVYSSNGKSTIIFNENVIGAVPTGDETTLIESYNNPHNSSDIAVFSKDNDFLCVEFEADSLNDILEDFNVEKMFEDVDLDDFNTVNMSLSEVEGVYYVDINGIAEDTQTITHYENTFKSMLNIYKSGLIQAQSITNVDSAILDKISYILDSVVIEENNSALHIQFSLD